MDVMPFPGTEYWCCFRFISVSLPHFSLTSVNEEQQTTADVDLQLFYTNELFYSKKVRDCLTTDQINDGQIGVCHCVFKLNDINLCAFLILYLYLILLAYCPFFPLAHLFFYNVLNRV